MKKLLFLFLPITLFAQDKWSVQTDMPQATMLHAMDFDERIVVKKTKLATGIEMEYAEKGAASGIPVIFLHGITDSWHSFENTLSLLPSTIHAYALSQRGHGNSGKPLKDYAARNFAADVAAFMKQQKITKAVIVGHSMGGVVAMQLATDFPKLVSALVIVSSDPVFSDNPGMPDFMEEVNRMEGSFSRAFMEAFQLGTIYNPIDSAALALFVDESMKVPLPVFKAALNGLSDVELGRRISSITQPVLLLWGDKDSFIGLGDQQFMLRQMKNATLKVYEETGHAIHWEHGDRFVKDLLQFVQGLNNLLHHL